jgi:hypothetical protein
LAKSFAELSAMSFADTDAPAAAPKADMQATRAAVPASECATGDTHSSTEILEQISNTRMAFWQTIGDVNIS